MQRILQIAVIADDITGAADTGGQFCPVVGPVHMAGAVNGELTAAAVQDAAGIAVFTNTRHADADAAANIVRLAAEKIRCLHPRQIYQKIDSCLRGNPGAEIDVLLQATGADASFVAPAFPEQGRTTVGDCQLIHGVPVAETEIGRDPRSPVHVSLLTKRLAAQSRMPVGHVDLACITEGPARLAARVRTLLDRGCRHIAFDAVQTVHLDAIAALACSGFASILPVGAAGLARSLCRVMALQLPRPAAADRPAVRKWLFVCGSASRMLADQIAMLVRSTGWKQVVLDPAALAAAGSPGREQVSEPLDEGAAGSLILSVRPILAAGPVAAPDKVVRGMAQVASEMLTEFRPDGVFLSGGDTAEAFWRQIGAASFRIYEEVLPGLMRGEFVGGPCSGLFAVTKAGAFGQADTLNQLVNCFK